MDKRKLRGALWVILLGILLVSSGCRQAIATQNESDKEEMEAVNWSEDTATVIALEGASAVITGEGAASDGGSVMITKAGTYVLKGKLDDGQIVVDVPDKEDVHLVLYGVELYDSDSAPLYVKEAGNVILTLQEGTENLVADGAEYVFPDEEPNEPNAAIFSKDDLIINGTGKLTVTANFNNGIASKDDLLIESGTIEIDAADDGLMGRDSVVIRAGTITIKADGDGVKSTNDEEEDKGVVVMEGGSLHIEAGADGMQAITSLRIEGGEVSIASVDDALHSNGELTVTGGEIALVSGDDAIHADEAVTITEGKIAITESYEGIEAKTIAIEGGEIHVVSSDDGINAASGDSGGGFMGGPGRGGDQSSIVISGGTISVDAEGDGFDSNGQIAMTGGTVIVHGPVMDRNGAIDYDGSFEISGGFLVAAGSAGMAQATSETSSQNAVLMTFSQQQPAGSLVHLEDGNGGDIATFAPSKAYQALLISSPELVEGEKYTLYTGGSSTGQEADGLYTGGDYKNGSEVVGFEIVSPITWLNEQGVTTGRSGWGGMSGGGRGNMSGGGRGQMPEGGPGVMPGNGPGEMPDGGTSERPNGGSGS
ncbi:carbohydrate-binding domain-containing protein [Paenibacillus sp. J5C_2022]|uniref:carbohydrate-binding domain-containing protein n=1 Tax=Paenibacillus sp. J5C2022 TaxID=2977129 RepID=UPI0021D036A6|nr:carbohydrate-binding domain-containing protein [Paenibacillus sp. J5C2022]MCU6710522.1 carbohydrate-binding domain-containing protein [Paenibacillus sp. J5C2022]